MSLTLHNIQYWAKMLSGKSVNHVYQGIGSQFDAKILRGYFNDMRNKVLFQQELLNSDEMPLVENNKGRRVVFPVAIFQFAFGLYDLYLETNDKIYIDKFWQCVEWAVNNQNGDGSWDNFSAMEEGIPPYGAMCQGEGASLLVRAYELSKNIGYKVAAKSALDFMLKPVSEGGTASYVDDKVILLECTHMEMILNGSIFAYWGLYDYCLIDSKNEFSKIRDKVLNTIIELLPRFDVGFWSYYSLDKKLSSPFYHKLHIAQLEAMALITESPVIISVLTHFRNYQRNCLCKCVAFIIKVFQKII